MPSDAGHHAPIVPGWAKSGEAFHIRIRTESFSPLPLTDKQLAPVLIKSVSLYHEISRWYCHFFLLMPDHVHALLIFPPDRNMSEIIGDWKAAHAKRLLIQWQGNYYEEMVSHGSELTAKAAYIRRNPVAKGLCGKETDWPWTLQNPI